MPYLPRMTYAAITGWGECMPPAILTNADLATLLDTSDEWIVSRTGMKERRVSHVSAIELSTVAAARALACANLPASDVDLIIYGSCSYDEAVPELRVRRPAQPRRHSRGRHGRQHRVHELPVRTHHRDRDDPHGHHAGTPW